MEDFNVICERDEFDMRVSTKSSDIVQDISRNIDFNEFIIKEDEEKQQKMLMQNRNHE